MALFQKQDFTPPVLSRKWITMQFRPNMLIFCQDHVVAILESGLLFREDSMEIEQESLYWSDEEYAGAWLTGGEKVVSALAVSAMFVLCPIRHFNRGAAVRLAGYLAAPAALRAAHRWRGGGSVRTLLQIMCDYLGIARRAAACCREYAALHANLASVATVVESTQRLLVQQQADMVNLLSRASSAVLGNAPWLRGDVAWEAVCRPGDSVMVRKIHHTFLVVQSLFLKHVAMAHYLSTNVMKVYKNHNERIYWLHKTVINYMIAEYRDNCDALERMYRLLKNCGTASNQNETKKPGAAINNSWLYSEVHTNIAKSCLELKIAHNKCNSIDMFLDSCGTSRCEVNLDILNKDIDDLIDNITKCLTTAQNSQIRLKNLQGKVEGKEPNKSEDVIEEVNVVKIDDKVPEAKDEVFYFVKTEDDESVPQAADVTTGPGAREKEASKVVLSELRRKLGKREDVMRERERQALKKTMPEFRDNVPEFPRQIDFEDFVDRKGFISKILKPKPKKSLKHRKIAGEKAKELFKKGDKYLLSLASFDHISDINEELYEANATLNANTELLTILRDKNTILVTKWRSFGGGYSSGLSDVEEESICSETHRNMMIASMEASNESAVAKSIRYAQKNADLSPTTSEEEFRGRILRDNVRRHRGGRHYYAGDQADEVDESLRPIEYTFGTGMAMASVLQGNNAQIPTMAQEEVFIGDGEVSEDSGNNGDE